MEKSTQQIQSYVEKAAQSAAVPTGDFLVSVVSTVPVGRGFSTKIVMFHSRFGVLEMATSYPAGYLGMPEDDRRKALVTTIKRGMDDFISDASQWVWASGSED